MSINAHDGRMVTMPYGGEAEAEPGGGGCGHSETRMITLIILVGIWW